MSSSPGNTKDETIAKVEKVFEDIVKKLCLEQPISITLKYNASTIGLSEDWQQAPTLRSHSFPGSTPQEAWRFTVLFRILGLIHEALADNTVISKRNIYYQDPSLFKSQAIVDRYVDVFAYTFGIRRAALNVTAAAKGLVVGSLAITRPDGTIVSKGEDGKPYLIDDLSEIRSINIAGTSWILVIEKESTFRTLASSRLHQTCLSGKGIILTVDLLPHPTLPTSKADPLPSQKAKGYPDLSTRSFLRHLSTSPQTTLTPPAPIYTLTDFDPDGIAIMSIYKHGSLNLSHENEFLNVAGIQWLGIRSRDILEGGNGRSESGTGGEADGSGLLRLSARDRRKAGKMLENSAVFVEGRGEEGWRREVQVMLMLNVKAEMEVLAEREGGVTGWVGRRLGEEMGLLG